MSIIVSSLLNFTKDGVTESFQHQHTATMSVAGYRVQVPTLGTAASAVSTANLSVAGYAFLRSLVTTTQATCTITFGRLEGTTLHSVVSLRPNEPAVFRLAAGEYGARAAAEGYRLQVAILEE
jgi:hypothetical protein